MMENLDKLLEMANAEFAAIAKNGKFKSREEIHSVYELIDIAKDIYCVWTYEDELEGGEEGMSSEGAYYRDGRGGRSSRAYEEGAYERRGRGRQRDSMGRFKDGGSYRDGGSYYRDGGSMRRGGSYYREGGKEEFAENLRNMMQEAPDEQTRQSIQKMIREMEQS